jgi:hypothetical protein
MAARSDILASDFRERDRMYCINKIFKLLELMKTFIIGTLLFLVFSGFDGSHDTLCSSGMKPILQLNFIGDARVQLATGKQVQLQDLIDQKKYVFINIWSGKGGRGIKDAQVADSIAEVYKNKLQVIGLLDEGNLVQLNKLIKKHQLKNVQGLVSSDIKKYLSVNMYPYGILFSKTGKLIEAGMDGKALATYLEKHVVTSRAKF